MPSPVFNRYERKYMINKKQRNELIDFIKNYLVEDPFSIDGESYNIYNIYFDTTDFSIIRNSISKPVYKEKLRLRAYKCPIQDEDIVFFEIKKKFQGRINKRRVNLKYNDAMNYIKNGIIPEFDNYLDIQIMREIDYFVKIYKAKPGAFISYNRLAYMSNSEDLRVTFDHQILFRTKSINLEMIGGTNILQSNDIYLMEVKSSDNFPFWLARKLSEYELYSQSFSKYGKAYQQYLLGGDIDDYILYNY